MYRSRAFHSRGPVVERSTRRFLRLVDADGLGTRQVVGFDREVTILRSAEATVVVVNGAGDIVSQNALHDDVWYGFLSCLGQLFGEARETADTFGVTPDGPLSVEIRVTVKDRPVLPAPPDPHARNRPPSYIACPEDWIDHRDAALAELWAAGGPGGDWDAIRILGPRTVVDGAAIWTSRDEADPEAAAVRLGTVMDQALAGLDPTEARAAWDRVEEARSPGTDEEAAA